jgi:hypothetical protein
MKNFGLLICGLLYVAVMHAQPAHPVMHSNRQNIKLFINGGENDWTITPSLHPDVLRLYHRTEKVYNVKFVSDIDSLTFAVNVNEPVYFDIVYKGDTAEGEIMSYELMKIDEDCRKWNNFTLLKSKA